MMKTAASVEFTLEGKSYTLIFDMAAVAAFEESTDLSIFEVVQQLGGTEGGGKPPKLSVMGSMLQAGLSRCHPDITREEAMWMVSRPEVQTAFGDGIKQAMGGDGDAEAAGAKPRPSKRGDKGKSGKSS